MSTQQIIIVIAVIVVFILAASQVRRGPRVTQIDRVVRKDKDSDDA
ncbi:MAG TPA: hypothetical protein VG434_08350 [Sphingomicrobium sp.]|nr:hypothetical protein [Sphingomicrobium sp.]